MRTETHVALSATEVNELSRFLWWNWDKRNKNIQTEQQTTHLLSSFNLIQEGSQQKKWIGTLLHKGYEEWETNEQNHEMKYICG